MKYKVWPVEEIASVGPELASLWRDNLGFTFDPLLKHRWYYLDNPQGRGGAFFLREAPPAGGGNGEGEATAPIGCIGLGVRRFEVRGESARAGIYVDMAVDRRHRTLFPALMLQRAARAAARERFDFAYGEPNEHAVKVFVKMGYTQVGQMRRFARVLHHAPFVERVLPEATAPLNPALAKLAGGALDHLNQVGELLRTPRGRHAVRFDWVDTIDDRFDGLWQATRGRFTVIGYRGADYLRWRYQQAPPHRRCELCTLSDAGSGRLRAYAAVHDERPLAALFDLFGPVEQQLLLLRAMMPALRAKGYESVSINLLGSPLLIDGLHALGFRQRELGFAVIVDPQGHPAAESLRNADSWHLTDGDQDG